MIMRVASKSNSHSRDVNETANDDANAHELVSESAHASSISKSTIYLEFESSSA